jgi:hypothetical protein
MQANGPPLPSAPAGHAWYLIDVFPHCVLDEFDLDCIESLRISRIKRVLFGRAGTHAWLAAKSQAKTALRELLHVGIAEIVGKKPSTQTYIFKRKAQFEFFVCGAAIACVEFSVSANVDILADEHSHARIEVSVMLTNGKPLLPPVSDVFWIAHK